VTGSKELAALLLIMLREPDLRRSQRNSGPSGDAEVNRAQMAGSRKTEICCRNREHVHRVWPEARVVGTLEGNERRLSIRGHGHHPRLSRCPGPAP